MTPSRGVGGRARVASRRLRVLAPFAAAVLIALAVLAIDRGEPDARKAIPTAGSASGSFALTNSRAGAAIFSAGPLGPGNTAQGSVLIRNAGTLAGRFRLEKRSLVDTPGPAGGVLSERLHLLVRQAGGPTIYSGPLASMPSRNLGRFAAGRARRYDFTATIQDGGPPPTALSGDNAYKLSSASVDFVWRGVSETSAPSPPAAREPSTTPGPPASPRPRDTTPPRLRVRIPGVQAVVRKRRLKTFVRCSERCTVRARGTMRINGRTYRVRTKTRRLRAHRRARMYFKISRPGVRAIRRRLSRGRRVTIRLRFTARDRAGNTRSVIRRAHLRRR